MNYGGDAAEQVVRMSLEGLDIVLRISGSAAKNLAAALTVILKEEEKTRGKSRLTSMIKSGKELTVFSIPSCDLQRFTKEAKRYGVLYCVVKDKGKAKDGICDIIARAEDAPKINRIVERFKLAAVSTKTEIGLQKEEQTNLNAAETDKLIDEVLGVNPTQAGAERSPSGENLKKAQAQDMESSKKPSVREMLNQYRQLEEQEESGVFEKLFTKMKKEKERE